MMNSMMNAMIRSMSKEEKEAMMLHMMPEMMKKADIKILMANMTETMGKMITLYGVYQFISKLLENKELKEATSKIKNGMHDKMPEMMPIMMPVMKEVMPVLMGKMSPMMGHMVQHMKNTGDCFLTDVVNKVPEMKVNMGEMMSMKCPEMAGMVIPEEKRKDFVKNMYNSVIKKNGIELTEKELLETEEV